MVANSRMRVEYYNTQHLTPMTALEPSTSTTTYQNGKFIDLISLCVSVVSTRVNIYPPKRTNQPRTRSLGYCIEYLCSFEQAFQLLTVRLGLTWSYKLLLGQMIWMYIVCKYSKSQRKGYLVYDFLYTNQDDVRKNYI